LHGIRIVIGTGNNQGKSFLLAIPVAACAKRIVALGVFLFHQG